MHNQKERGTKGHQEKQGYDETAVSIFRSERSKCDDGRLSRPISKTLRYTKESEESKAISWRLLLGVSSSASCSHPGFVPVCRRQCSNWDGLWYLSSAREVWRGLPGSILVGLHGPKMNETEKYSWPQRLCRDGFLYTERRRRVGAGLGAARSGDFDKAECGIGTSSASGAARCRTGGGSSALAMR